MKTRTDFISNSSSCSFIVDDAKSAMSTFKRELCRSYDYRVMPYGIEDIRFYLRGSKRALDKVQNHVECGEVMLDHDDVYMMSSIPLCTLMSIPAKALNGVASIEVSADDANSGNVMVVKLLREFFMQHGFSTKDTGDKWSGLDDNNFMSKLLINTMYLKYTGEE